LSEELVLDLDDPRCADPQLAGAKAAWLARGRQLGLAVLPGVVVPVDVSVPALTRGVETLTRRGSGGARLEVGHFPVGAPLVARVARAASDFGQALVVRSSSVLEGESEWSGAFASYVDVAPSEIEKAIAGCWASAFTVSTLRHLDAAGLDPISARMAVLIQPLIRPDYGGVARLDGNGEAEVIGIKGSPAPLVQGWESGARARVAADGGTAATDDDIDYLGLELIREVSRHLRTAQRLTTADSCEWAWAGGRLFLLQLGRQTGGSGSSSHGRRPVADVPRPNDPRIIQLARLARRYPGPLGETLVLSWAAADPALAIEHPAISPGTEDPPDVVTSLYVAQSEAALLTAETWQMPESRAAVRAASVLRQARGTHPEPALDCLAALRVPDHERAVRLLSLLAIVEGAIDDGRPGGSRWMWQEPIDRLASILRGETRPGPRRVSAGRTGIDRWEPFQAGVVQTFGIEHQGLPASLGLGCGRLCYIAGADQIDDFRSRDVVVTTHPVPNLAPLLWDASGLVTTGGGPAAHLFESARSLNVPAVCAVDLAGRLGMELTAATGRFAVAIDGNRGVVFTSEW
jgi:phosphohistidine swiveling domain-containing protein